MTGSLDSANSNRTVSPPLSTSEKAVSSGKAPSKSQAAAATGATAIGSLTTNYQTFLNLLMTQLKNQDPTTPMDTNQFTSELVQFSSVEQQINTNTSLTQLIQLTQSGELVQASAMVGHSVALSGSDMPVQSGSGKIQFAAAAAGPVTVAIYNSVGTHIGDSLIDSKKGLNTWGWNATDASGNTEPDGAYKVVVTATDAGGATKPLAFNVLGLATGVVKNGSSLQLQLGSVTTDFSNVQSVLN